MRQLLRITIPVLIALAWLACGEQSVKETDETRPATESTAAPERPSDADLVAFKVYHHTVYKETTAKQAGVTRPHEWSQLLC